MGANGVAIRGFRAWALAGLMGACLLGGVTSARATTVVVANKHDSGPGSLRRAVEGATQGEKIKVPKGVYRLTSGELSTDKSLRIVGTGARKTILDGTDSSRIIEDTATAEKLSLSDLTVRNGNADGGNGGGIEVAGALTLVRVAVTGNRVSETASTGYGGGIDVSGALVVRSSLIAHNYGYNGGAANAESTVSLLNSTITHNSAGSPTSGDNGNSGAIETSDQPITVLSSTIAFNRCFNGAGCGGAFYNGDFVFTNSIIAQNFAFESNGQPAGSAGNPGSKNNCYGADTNRYASAGFNLSDTDDCVLTKASDHVNVNPHLGNLKNNGGPTDTLAPKSNSRAINHASPRSPGSGGTACAKVDQRGVKRPQGRRCDIGALEVKKKHPHHHHGNRLRGG